MLDIVKSIGSAILIASLLFFIFSNAIGLSNYKRRAVGYLIFGMALLTILLFGLFDEYKNISLKVVPKQSFIFPGVVFVMTLTLTVYSFVMARKYNHNFKTFRRQSPREELYLYLVYKYEDVFLLEKNNDKYLGDLIPFDKKILFHDEMISRFIDQQKLNINKAKFIGKLQINSKKKKIYYCYLIDVYNLLGLDEKYQVNKYDLPQIEMDEFHKKIVLRIGLQENFDIRI